MQETGWGWGLNCPESKPLSLPDTVYLQPFEDFSGYEFGSCNGTVDWSLSLGEAVRHDHLCGGIALSADEYGDVEFKGDFSTTDNHNHDPRHPLDWSGIVFGYEDSGHFYIVMAPRNVETLEAMSTTVAADCDGVDDCCTSDNPCTIGEGNCVFDVDCQPGLRCDDCQQHGFQFEGNCCYKPPMSNISALLGNSLHICCYFY